jgi:DNA invertase Pin-like site-specific DNA recombinase
MRIPETCPLPPGAVVWGYLRDSGGPNQDRSVEQQRDTLETYCEKHNLILERVFVDEARQGDSAESRAALWQLMAAAEQYPEIHDLRKRARALKTLKRGVVFWTFARLGRDSIQSQWIVNNLRIRGLKVTSLADPMITGNENIDPVLESVLAMKNEMDLQFIGREASRGLHAIVALRDTDPGFLAQNPDWQPTGAYLSIWPIRTTPRGFRAERIAVGVRRSGKLHTVQRLVPDPETWDRVLLAWRMRIKDGASYRQIQQATGLYKSIGCFSTFFRNRLYTGVLEYGGEVYGAPTDPFVPPLIPETWYEAEASRREERAFRRRKGGTLPPDDLDERYSRRGRLLTSLVYCARCGAKMWVDIIPAGVISTTGQVRKAWPHYQCSRSGTTCDAGKVNAVRLERAVIRQLRQEVLTPDNLRQHIGTLLEHTDTLRAEKRQHLSALEKQLAGAKRKAGRLADALAERPVSETLLCKLDEAEADARRLVEKIAATQAELAYYAHIELSDADLEAMCDRLAHAFNAGDLQAARRAIAGFIQRIEVEPGRLIRCTLHYTFPVPDPKQGLYAVPPRGLTTQLYPIW